MTLWAPPDPWTLNQPAVIRREMWAVRARRYRRSNPRCERCEWKPIVKFGRRFGPGIDVHHVYGKNGISPVGLEWDYELMSLCEPCHDEITVAHRQLGRKRGEMAQRWRGGQKCWVTVDPVRYSLTIAEVTGRYMRRRPWLRIVRNRLMFGRA